MYIDFLNKYRNQIINSLPRGAANRIAKQIGKPNNTVNSILKGRVMMIKPGEETIQKIVELALQEINSEVAKNELREKLAQEFEQQLNTVSS